MKLKIEITLIEEMLGTKAANPEVFATFIASKAPDGDKRREEIETAEESGMEFTPQEVPDPSVVIES